ncbi:MAG: hypothetical protein ABFD96_25315 [Armatimonadia bacterium]
MSWLRIVLGWLGLPTWILPVVLLAAAASVVGAAYLKGRMDSAGNCREAQLQAELATLQRDMAALKAADQIEAMLNADLEAERQKLEKEVADYEAALAARPDSACRLTPDDVGRLSGQRKR